MAQVDETLLIAGEPMRFETPGFENYVAAYNGELGGRLLAVSTIDGKILEERDLIAPPVWDGIAFAYKNTFIALEDGTIMCLGE